MVPPGLFDASTLACNTTLDFSTYLVDGNFTYTGNIILDCNSKLGVRYDMYNNPDRLRVYASNGNLVFDSGYAGVEYIGCDGPLPINPGPLGVGCQGLAGKMGSLTTTDEEACRALPALNVTRAPTSKPEAYTFTVDSPCFGSSWAIIFDCTSPPIVTANQTTGTPPTTPPGSAPLTYVLAAFALIRPDQSKQS